MARHAHRVPIYSSTGSPKPLIYVSRAEAERLELLGHVRRISRLKAPNLVMRFCSLQHPPKRTNASITSTEIELNALGQILSADTHAEGKRVRNIAQKLLAWPSVGDEKAARAATKISVTETITP